MPTVTNWGQFTQDEEEATRERGGEARALLRLLQAPFGPSSAERTAWMDANIPEPRDFWLTPILTVACSDGAFS